MSDGVYNVMDFGATAQGFTDDSKAVQDAVDAAHAARGGVVFFPPGNYRIGEIDLRGRERIHFKGVASGRSGPVSLRIMGDDEGSMFIAGPSKYIRFTDLYFYTYDPTFRGTIFNSESLGTNWASEATLHVTFDHCTWFGTGYEGTNVKVGPAYRWVFRECDFQIGAVAIDGLGQGINQSNSVSVLDSRFSANYTEALIKNPKDLWRIVGNALEPLRGGAPGFIVLDTDQNPKGVTVNDNWGGDTTAAGVWVQAKGEGWRICGNLFNTSSGASSSTGIQLVGDMYGLSVTGNWFYGAGVTIDYGQGFEHRNIHYAGNGEGRAAGPIGDSDFQEIGAV